MISIIGVPLARLMIYGPELFPEIIWHFLPYLYFYLLVLCVLYIYTYISCVYILYTISTSYRIICIIVLSLPYIISQYIINIRKTVVVYLNLKRRVVTVGQSYGWKGSGKIEIYMTRFSYYDSVSRVWISWIKNGQWKSGSLDFSLLYKSVCVVVYCVIWLVKVDTNFSYAPQKCPSCFYILSFTVIYTYTKLTFDQFDSMILVYFVEIEKLVILVISYHCKLKRLL